MSSNPIRLQYLLRKYLDNKLLPEEQPEFWKLLSELSENDFVTEELSMLYDAEQTNVVLQPHQIATAYQQLQEKIKAHHQLPAIAAKPVRKIGWITVSVAASLLFAIALFWMNQPETVSTDSIASRTDKVSKMPHLQTLADGSIISLNENSFIDSTHFTDKLREVFFRGEGFFNVQHDPSRPFLVHAQGIVTRVLGTSFNVKAYPGQKRVLVTVTKGKVQVEKPGQLTPLGILTPGEQLVVEENHSLASIHQADIEEVIEWKKSALLFDNQSLPEAVEVLQKHFSAAIRLQDTSLNEQRFTADFSDKTLVEMMDIISVLTGSTWRKQGDAFLIEETKKLP